MKLITRKRIVIATGVLVVIIIGCVVALRFVAPANTASSVTGILTAADLDNPSIRINSETSDVSVENITKELKAKIDEQIAAKQNPYETVYKLAATLSNTANKTRKDQVTVFVEDFLASHEDSLWFEVDSEVPSQADVNHWKAQLYALLVYNYQFIAVNEFTNSAGKIIDTTAEQLKYINLYLTLAYDPASKSRATNEYKEAQSAYDYNETQNFLVLKKQLSGGQ